ncbi:MAG: hypothetical protein IJW77_02990 [Clostridia bacterium]|nr:hypothetical protein [Clostridia bacterium]
MNIKEIAMVRELAKQYMEAACTERHIRMRRRFRDTNDLKCVRPPVLMDEIPWHEMNYEHALDCVCEDDRLRGIEYALRVGLYREKYFKCDNMLEPFWVVRKSFSNTGNGFAIKEDRLAVDQNNGIVSHRYYDVFEDEAVLAQYHDPVITPHPERDAEQVAFMQEVLGDTMPVVLQGHGIYYAPWDRIAMLRGVEPILIDMYDNPEYLHTIIALFTRGMQAEMDQMEQYGLYDPRVISLHCTPGSVTQPGGREPDEGAFGCRHIWFRTMAQMFSSVSPDMHDEFDIQYSLPLARRCAYTYYGCCEPLHDRIDILKQYPNLRKIGVSPWADVERSAEIIGGDYVLSRKPNPAHVAAVTDPEVIRCEITETVLAAQKYGCPFDYTLKDISTVGYRPQNLMVWAEVVSDVLDGLYGEA